MKMKGEVRDMAVLSKPVDLAFEVTKEKTKQFLESSKESMLDKALARASAHKSDKKIVKED
ncbi:MAG: hypothetical protein ACI4GV_08010 [Acutalibacteraceae bacterium]